ncbi:MAG TPA: uroporphyrinogen-III synthase [Steroidobacteraceae bacterium]|jgi:uroporphyrinogen III methyltransferase/synthase|nr:uroporphyrinogen-III synthase [Steroidobacteraceae bacterium]
MSAAQRSRPVVVTRAESADGPLSRELRNLGLEVLTWPAVSVTPADSAPLDSALAELASFGWLVFASRHAVAAVLERVPKPPATLRVAAVGRATALTLRQRGWSVDLVPEEASAGALVAAFAAQWGAADAGVRILYPASSRALPTIAAGLRELGAVVTQVEAYRTDGATLDVDECRAWIRRGGLGAVTFASPSAVAELARALGDGDFARLLDEAPPVAIGRTTAAELAARGRTATLAEPANLQGLALAAYRVMQTRA